jgi:hypothetical protein
LLKITYHVGQHDGGYAYRLDNVWSEPFPTHHQALEAAKIAAERQHLEGRDAEISYQTADGIWRHEHALGGDRPETVVVDDGRAAIDVDSPSSIARRAGSVSLIQH